MFSEITCPLAQFILNYGRYYFNKLAEGNVLCRDKNLQDRTYGKWFKWIVVKC